MHACASNLTWERVSRIESIAKGGETQRNSSKPITSKNRTVFSPPLPSQLDSCYDTALLQNSVIILTHKSLTRNSPVRYVAFIVESSRVIAAVTQFSARITIRKHNTIFTCQKNSLIFTFERDEQFFH